MRTRTPTERAQHYRDLAERLREMATTAPSDQLAKELRDVAVQYDGLAERAEQQT